MASNKPRRIKRLSAELSEPLRPLQYGVLAGSAKRVSESKDRDALLLKKLRALRGAYGIPVDDWKARQPKKHLRSGMPRFHATLIPSSSARAFPFQD
jgi:hypothetical protein